jgi:hypothetical protein
MPLKKFKVTACYTVYCYATVEAATEEEAYITSKEMDGGDFEMEEDYGLSDWHIESIVEVI